ncbi:L-seryl-tRNA(Sec) selenium transferase [soil metagenome]
MEAAAAHAAAITGSAVTKENLVSLVQPILNTARVDIEAGTSLGREEILARIEAEAHQILTQKLRPVINATGILIHTNLGRAPVSEAAAQAMADVAAGPVALELDPASNRRGGRMDEICTIMRLLTGAESTLVVNNNAAAILLTLSAIAANREVIVSRGEAVEIGGGFRIPDVLEQSGARLVEVGTTNRTYSDDYARAITDRTAALLSVHRSNFRIEGFTAAPKIEEMAEVARNANVLLVEDQGSGALADPSPYGLGRERTIGESIAAGVSIVTASGDKLLGGPQAGLITGNAQAVESISRHPLARAVRADKSTLAGIGMTLRHYLAGEQNQWIPVWQMISASADSIRSRAEHIRAHLIEYADAIQVIASESTVGGGSLPGETLPSWALAISPAGGRSADRIATRFRMGDPAVFGRIADNRILFDLRSVLMKDDEALTRSIRENLAVRQD